MRTLQTLTFLFLLHLAGQQGLAQSVTASIVAGTPIAAEGLTATGLALPAIAGVAVDARGNLYIAAASRNRVFKVTPAGALTTFAGTSEGFSGDGGPAIKAQLNGPQGLAVDSTGNVYIGDCWNYRVRKVTTDGIITTVAGSGASGFAGDGVSATSAKFNFACAYERGVALALDSLGNLYISDSWNGRLRKVTPGGIISTIAGGGNGPTSGDGGPATAATLLPYGVAVDSSGNIYVVDASVERIRKISPNGIIQPFAGVINLQARLPDGDNGPALGALLGCPHAVAVDVLGNVLILDECYGTVRKVNPAGIITTVAGSTARGFAGDGGPATAAQFRSPIAIAADSTGNLFIADTENYKVRKVTSNGVITTVAGAPLTVNDRGGSATAATLSGPWGLALDSSGNVYFADNDQPRIRAVNSDGGITTIAGSGFHGYKTGTGSAAEFESPRGMASDSSGNLYIADSANHDIRKISPAGIVTYLAGGYSGSAAQYSGLNYPEAVGMDSAGNIYIADTHNHRVRKILTNGIIVTIAGNGQQGFSGDGGPATSAALNNPTGVAADSSGNVYIVDRYNNRIRKVGSDGTINTVVTEDNASAVCVDSGDAVYFSTDRKVLRLRGDGSTELIFDGSTQSPPFLIQGIVVNSSGEVFVSDYESRVIRKLTPPPDASRPTVGYAILRADTGQRAPAGLLVFSSIQNSVVVSEAGVQATPAVTGAMLFAEFNSTNLNTGVAIANPNNRTATVDVVLWSDDGSARLAAKTLSIPANGQTAKLVTELFPDFTTSGGVTFRNSVTVRSDVAVAITTLRLSVNTRGDSLLTTLPVTNLSQSPSTDPLGLPQIADGGGFTTQIILLNPTSRAVQGTVEFYSQTGSALPVTIDGQRVSTLPYSIPAGGLFFKKTDGTASAIAVGSAIVRPNAGQSAPSGTAIFAFRLEDVLVSEAAVPASQPLRRARVYVDYSEVRNTGVAISTFPGFPLSAQLTMTGSDGSASRTFTATLDLAGGGQTAKFVSEIFASIPAKFRGVLEIASNTSFSLVALRQTSTGRGDALFTTLPVANPDAPLPAELIFPHLVLGGGYQTEIILISNGEASATGVTVDDLKSNLRTFGGVIIFKRSNATALPVWENGSFSTQLPFNVGPDAPYQLLPHANEPKPVIETSALPDARMGINYNAVLVASGGQAPYVWALIDGGLWPQLTLNANGSITGAPAILVSGTTKHEDFFTVQVTDAGGRVARAQLSLTTRPPHMNFPLPAVLPPAVVRQPYNFALPAPIGGSGPYHYKLDTFGGFPPFGITVNPFGVLSGTPVTPETRRFKICAIDLTAENDCQPTSLTVEPPPRRTLSVSRAGSGGGSIASNPAGIACGGVCDAQYDDGSRVTLTASADNNSVFTGWAGSCGGAGSCVLTMDTDRNATASFAKKIFVLVGRGGDGSGTVTSNPAGINCGAACSAGFAEGSQVNLTATASTGSTFAGWDGACGGTGTCALTLNADKAVTARFALSQQRTLTVSKAGSGSGTVTSNPAGVSCGSSCSASFTDGVQVTLTATASAGSEFLGWSGSCSGTGACVVTMNASRAVTATFSSQTPSGVTAGTFAPSVQDDNGPFGFMRLLLVLLLVILAAADAYTAEKSNPAGPVEAPK